MKTWLMAVPVDKAVSISGLKQLMGISALPNGGLKIGALTSLAEIAAHAAVIEKYGALTQTEGRAASGSLGWIALRFQR